MDEPALRSVLPVRQTVSIGSKRVGIVHGHGGATALSVARRAFPRGSVDAVVFGHSHLPLIEWVDDALLFNPGSPTDRRLAPRCSFGRLSISDTGDLVAEHVWI